MITKIKDINRIKTNKQARSIQIKKKDHTTNQLPFLPLDSIL